MGTNDRGVYAEWHDMSTRERDLKKEFEQAFGVVLHKQVESVNPTDEELTAHLDTYKAWELVLEEMHAFVRLHRRIHDRPPA